MKRQYLFLVVVVIGIVVITGLCGCDSKESGKEAEQQPENTPAKETEKRDIATKEAIVDESIKTEPKILKVSYEDFPAELKTVLNERIAALQSNRGICVAGRIAFSDGAPIRSGKDVMVNLYHGIDEPLQVYEGGWFIMVRALPSHYAGPDKGFILRAFGYDPIDASITIMAGEITYVDFEMAKTPSAKLACIKVAVTDDQGRPVEQAIVRLIFPFAFRRESPVIQTQTGSNGEYSFDGLSSGDYPIFLTKRGYGSERERVTVSEGETVVKNVVLYRGHKITIDYVYQADGSRSFTTGDLQAGTVNWDLYDCVDFSDGKVERRRPDKDLELRQEKGVVKFDVSRMRGHKGLYDAGEVPFDSVTQAAETDYTTHSVPCKVGHVYVVRTFAENKYAKFIVKSIMPY